MVAKPAGVTADSGLDGWPYGVACLQMGPRSPPSSETDMNGGAAFHVHVHVQHVHLRKLGRRQGRSICRAGEAACLGDVDGEEA